MNAFICSFQKCFSSALCCTFFLFSGAVLAHYPLMHCQMEGVKIACEAGYSDGSKAVDYEVRMFDYDDNLIAKVDTDIRSIATFEKMVEHFYIVFDSGHEYPVEVDSVEIQ